MRVGQARARAAAERAGARGRHVGLAALAVLQRGGRVLRRASAAPAARQGQWQPALLGVRHVAAQPTPAAIVRQQHVSTSYYIHYCQGPAGKQLLDEYYYARQTVAVST